MIPFIWNPRHNELKKAEQWLPAGGRGHDWLQKGSGTFWDDGNVLSSWS